MCDPRHITLEVHYDRQPRFGRSLRWIAPELHEARLRLTTDRIDDEDDPLRTWAGFVDGATFGRLADAWRLDERPDSPPSDYVFDGMNWEVEGSSPIVYVSLRVGGAGALTPITG